MVSSHGVPSYLGCGDDTHGLQSWRAGIPGQVHVRPPEGSTSSATSGGVMTHRQRWRKSTLQQRVK